MRHIFQTRAIASAAFVFALCGAGAIAFAQPEAQPPPGCKAWNDRLPPAWIGWAQPAQTVSAARTPDRARQAAVSVGTKAAVALAPAASVHMRVETPDVDPPADAHKGILSLQVPADGLYWIASSEGLWIDVVQNGAILMSGDHGPGPTCASIRKAVQFMLKKGDAEIQLSDNRGEHVDIMVVGTP